MVGKFLIVAGLYLLAIGAQCNALSEYNPQNPDYEPVDGLRDVKKLAIEAITRYYNQAKDHCEGYFMYIDKFTHYIKDNGGMSSSIKNIAERFAATLTEVAEKLNEKGRQHGKPLGYFQCVKKNREQAVHEVHKQEMLYRDLMLSAQEKGLRKAWQTRIFMKNLRSAFDDILETLTNEINACVEPECVEKSVGTALKIFRFSRKLMTNSMMSFVKAFYTFNQESCENVVKVNGEMERDVMRGLKNMNNCWLL